MADNECQEVCSRQGTAASRGDSVNLRRVWRMGMPTGRMACGLRRDSPACSGQFQQVVGAADQTPLTGNLRPARGKNCLNPRACLL